ncbi:XRE family transcriptional regulator [Acinetobacter shaoyimingii]|uniref:XRE family transcriptional regulator n=1 Tax=Acinetobacter shaoyimingii TaxID=2715164 RepID=A0A6G8RSH8_9GAMM|nr:XRE family transcriptional regulator [Acinetobacter shaoyimingii]QIO04673.1 XRE family transcriptional regulator [Acinetobacter shaoyimingii]
MSEQLQQKPKAPRKKFKLTKQLIRIALDNGHTQISIQKMCRLSSQSQVSDWKNGVKLAYEDQIKPLLDLYGHKLRKVTSQLYQVHKSEEEIQLEEENGTEESFPIKFILVEGKVILREKFINPQRDYQGRIKRKDAQAILSIHDQGDNKFRCVIQKLITFKPNNNHPAHHEVSANFLAEITEPLDINELIQFVRNYREESLVNEEYLINYFTIDYLLLNSLVMNGYQVKEVEVLPATW